ncbi:enterobactin synthase subunit F [Shimwellia pseudoproteus]|uniref:enterobactin synthase subunit F n=1 Tax=Shimwellia pseudoproteus TaxID=570012 RepID=UPI0018EB8B1E|nr:enterobactin synthase subunit F [Shimwellia pseudoproteus]MBJ3815406.1 enterobactin synthase subunit F [Shimwellia pseudoproteus]
MQQITAFPLVAAQTGIWMADKLSLLPNSWSVAHFVELNGELDAPHFARAIVLGMMEADTLRMRFEDRQGEVWQWFDASLEITAPQVLDLRHEQHPQAAARAWMARDMDRDLRLDSGEPLYHHSLIQVADQQWFWYQRYHHLVVDGFSFTAITRRIAEIYTALCRNTPLADSPFTAFAEVAQEYRQYRASPAWAKDAAFWREKVATMAPPVTLSALSPADQPSALPIIRQKIALNTADFAAVTDTMRQHGLSAADGLLALISLWLGRLSGRQAFSAGFIFMRRIGSAALCATGPVLNVLPYDVRIMPGQTLAALAHALAAEMKTCRRHQRYDAEQVQRDRGAAAQGSPLYSTVVNLKMFDYRLDVDGIDGITHQLASGPVRDLEIALYLDEQGQGIVELLANPDRYAADSLRRHLERLQLLVRQFAEQPDLACDRAGMLHPGEQQRLARVNDTGRHIAALTLSEIIHRQAGLTPAAPALADAAHQLNYRQMRSQVVALARQLQARGVQPGDIVAVALPRSVFLSLALQAIVECGAAWLPLDTGYPDERLHMMLEDARPRLLIADDTQLARFADLPALATMTLTALLPVEEADAALGVSRPAHTAYVIFTSGSTGRPKGVMVDQRAIVNRLLWMQDHYPLGDQDVVLQKTPSSFDVSVWEFFWPLMVGARLVMAPPDAHRDPRLLRELFSQWQVTTTHFVPSMLAAFVSALEGEACAAQCRSLRRVFCSGEALPVTLCREWEQHTGVPLHNLYGPTEAAVDVSWYPAFGQALAQVKGNSVPIGWPVWNTGLRILDASMQPVPPGVAGDLYLTGIQLAQGYLGRADLTASRFVADPQQPGQRMYRTGDVARWLDNGAVEYLGRSDDQLKIRGQRIELGDIDRALLQLPGVAQGVANACVLNDNLSGSGDARQLVGYLVAEANQQGLDCTALREQLAEALPPHMVPVILVELGQLPLSANGKLDRKALPRPVLARAAGRAPLPGLETSVAQAFAALLGCEVERASDDFFALGGHSLLAMRLAAQLREQLHQPVSVGQVIIASTVEALAATLAQGQSEDDAQQAGFDAILPLRRAAGPTLFCFHPASGLAWQFSVLQRYLPGNWSVTGIQSPRPDGPMQQCATLDEVVDSHLVTLRQQQPRGPYYLLGYSLGGTLAQALAARLEQAGESVAFLGLLDTWPPESQNWADKAAGELDPAVLAEIERERDAFLAAQRGQPSAHLFNTISGNYRDAVRLLTTAHTHRFGGKTTLFVASQTQALGMDARHNWGPWLGEMAIYPVDCAHVDIISPAQLAHIGPLLCELLGERLTEA